LLSGEKHRRKNKTNKNKQTNKQAYKQKNKQMTKFEKILTKLKDEFVIIGLRPGFFRSIFHYYLPKFCVILRATREQQTNTPQQYGQRAK